MKPYKVNTLRFTALAYMVASNAAEFDQLAKKTDACVDSANSNTLYRSTLANFRGNFLHGVETVGKPGDENYKAGIPGFEEITGIKRLTEKTGKTRGEGENKEDIEVYAETESKYYDRALAELVKNQQLITIDDQSVGPFDSIDSASAAFTGLAQRHLDAIPFDPSETERKEAGPKKIAKVYITTAEKLIAAGRGEAVAAELSSKLGITYEATVDSLSRAISEDQRRKREAVGAEYGV